MKNANDKLKDTEKQPKTTEKELEKTKNNEIGGRGGLDPSRFGDWEIAGKCVDF